MPFSILVGLRFARGSFVPSVDVNGIVMLFPDGSRNGLGKSRWVEVEILCDFLVF